MSTKDIAIPLFVAAVVVACGGSSAGVDEKKPLPTLTATEYDRLCNWINSQLAPLDGKACADGSNVRTNKLSCVGANPYLTAMCNTTVLGLETCIRTYAMSPCNYGGLADVAECAGVFACDQ